MAKTVGIGIQSFGEGKKVIILLDEYDTPMQEAYVNGFWDELVHLQGVCLTLPLSPIRIWNGQL